MFIDQTGEFGLAHLYPTQKAYLLSLTRRGFFGEFATMVNAYIFAAHKGRHLFVDVDAMGLAWDALFELRPQSSVGATKDLYPSRRRLSLKVGQREDFREMSETLLYFREKPVVKLPFLRLRGTLEELSAKIVRLLFRPRFEIAKSAKRKAHDLGVLDVPFYALDLRAGENAEAGALPRRRAKGEAERIDPAEFMDLILAEDPAATVFVMTDDYRQIVALRDAYPQAAFVTLCPATRLGDEQAAEAAADAAMRTTEVRMLIEEALIANRATRFYSPYRSDISHLIHLLRYPRPSTSGDAARRWTPFPTLLPLSGGLESVALAGAATTRMAAMDRLGRDGGVEVATSASRHIFELSGYVRCVSPSAATAPDILLLSAVRDPDEWRLGVPDALWARAAAGETRIVLDASDEGTMHDDDRARRLHRFLADRGVRDQPVVYITQDRGYGADYQAWLNATQQGDGFRILYADLFIRKFFMGLESQGAALFETRLKRFRERGPTRERRFICLNHNLRESKIYFLMNLLRDDLWRQGFISFGGIGMSREGKVPSFKIWPDEARPLRPYLDQLNAMGRVMLGDVGNYTDPDFRVPNHDTDMPEHDRSWFSIITETEMRGRPSRVTEKPFKALVNFHPVIFLGNPGSLPLLRDLGFKTFPGFFDESYDEILDPKARFQHVYNQVVELCHADEALLKQRADAVEEALIHNAWWGLTRLPDAVVEKDLALLAAVLG